MNSKVYAIISTIPGWLTKHEGEFLEKSAASLSAVNGAIVEIGSYQGKSTVYLAQARERVYAIDPHKGDVSGGKTQPTFSKFLHNIKILKVDRFVEPIVKTSKQAASGWNKPIKLLFIDGLHDTPHAMEDFLLWSPHVVDGGIIAMHDAFCGWDGAGEVAMRHLVYSPDIKEIGVVGSIIFATRGKSSVWERIHIVCNQLVIELCSSIYKSTWIPKRTQFILIHRVMRVFLLNRFSSFC